jgi:hypothetical protein
MANDFTILAEALDGFRRMYGVNVRPEDMPREWTAVVMEVRDCLNEMIDDCNAQMDDAPYWAQEDR